MMKQRLKVSFDNPEHGWVGLTISQGEKSLTIIASYTPSDSFLDLTNALHNLLCYRVGGVVTWHEEPAETEMRFSISGEDVELEVCFFSDHRRDYGRGERELAITGSYEEICTPFWRALRSLQGRFSAEELDARWHRPFPWKEIDLLTDVEQYAAEGRQVSDGKKAMDIEKEDEMEVLKEVKSSSIFPLSAKGEMLGIISLGPRLGDLPYSREDEQMLMSVAGPATLAIENAILVEQMIVEAGLRRELEAENEIRAKELEEARQLQLSMLPKSVPQLPHLEIEAYMKPAAEVGGDYYDFHLGDDGVLTVAVGDATGHGLKAGTVVTAMKSLFRTFAGEPEIVPVFARSSRVLKEMNLRSLFMGLTMVKVNGRRMKISSAGMPPALIYRAETGSVEEVMIKAMPLGSVRGYSYRERELTLGCGDVVVLMSDGLPERFNRTGEMFDYSRTKDALAQAAAMAPREIIERLVDAGEAWAEGRPQDDDITFVAVKVKL
jgi:serine phosphatase RsbU (regulator of sigma subunit)